MSPTPSAWLAPALIGGAALLLSLLETLSPLRERSETRTRRWSRNLATAAIALAVARPLQLLLLLPLASWLEETGLGLLHLLDWPPLLELLVALLLLDGTLWYWHWANHRVRLLWRFHAVHHEDKDLDASTALRFHFGELGLSVLWRSLQVVVIGATAEHLLVYTLILTLSALFHHSNLRLPFSLERRLVHLIVTPRMHGIHHNRLRQETDSNYSSILSVWDRLHGSLRLNRPQEEVVIGLPGSQAPAAGLWQLQVQPFRRQPPFGAEAPAAAEAPPGPTTRLAP